METANDLYLAFVAGKLKREFEATLVKQRPPVRYWWYPRTTRPEVTKRDTIEALLVRLTAEHNVGHPAALKWFVDPTPLDRSIAHAEGGEYPFEVLEAPEPITGTYVRSRNEIWIKASLDLGELVATAAHEFAHSLGIDDETLCESFAQDIRREWQKGQS